MLFNSADFFVFGIVALALHWYAFNGSAKRQNAFLLAASWRAKNDRDFLLYDFVIAAFNLLPSVIRTVVRLLLHIAVR